ncbi:MAG: hypothetical protein HGA54_07355, partial [Actinobacteria bacterium]|nr:hypothetical protein [Actinomycetota bacterium]
MKLAALVVSVVLAFGLIPLAAFADTEIDGLSAGVATEGVSADSVGSGDSASLIDATVLQSEAPIEAAVVPVAALPTQSEIEAIIDDVAEWQVQTITNPSVESVGGEWTVIALARYGYDADDFYQTYLANLNSVLDDTDGVLSTVKYTEYSRVALAVSSLGMDANNISGYEVLPALADFDKVVWQGVNGPIFALIALDSRNYAVPSLPADSTTIHTTRDKLIQDILDKEISGGGWTLSGSIADVDTTSMVIQALAPYRTRPDVQAAVDRGLEKLSALQNVTTGSWGTSENNAQVIVALTSIGVSLDDARFVKNGRDALDALMDCYDAGTGAFKHIPTGGVDVMATDQAMCALVAYWRSVTGKTAFYDMTDATEREFDETVEREAVVAAIDGLEPGTLCIDDKTTVSKLVVRLGRLSDFERKAELTANLSSVLVAIEVLEEKVSALDSDIWDLIDPQNITLDDATVVTGLMARYEGIAEADRAHLTNIQSLLDAYSIITDLGRGIIPQQVFETIMNRDVNYSYGANTERGFHYTITIQGTDVTVPADMHASVVVGEVPTENITTTLPNAYWICFSQAEALPATVTLATEVGEENGNYVLYRFDAPSGGIEKLGSVVVIGGTLTFSTDRGGSYFIVPAVSVAASTSGTQGSEKIAAIVDGVVRKAVFEEIEGQDINLRIEGTSDENRAYTLIFNGEEITDPVDF